MEYEIIGLLGGAIYPYEDGSTHITTRCPACKKDGHLYINKSTGMFDCKVCGESGNFKRFQYLIMNQNKNTSKIPVGKSNALTLSTVERFAENLKNHTTVEHYLYNERKLSPEVVAKFKIGVNNSGDISIPHFVNDKVVAMKYRYLGTDPEKPKYIYETGSNVEVYNNEILKEELSWVLIVEGEFDVMAAYTYGLKQVIGVPGAGNKLQNWIDRLKAIETIYICYDVDEAGQKGAYDMASRIGLHKCKNVKLPENDMNECLKKGISKDLIRSALTNAEEFDVPGVVKSIAFDEMVVRDLMNPNQLLGHATGHKQFDKITGGLGEQQLTVLSGVSSAGKTTFSTHLMHRYARQGLPVAIFSLESPVKKLLKDLIKMQSGKDIHTLTKPEIEEHLKQLSALPLYWYDSRNVEGSLNIWKFKNMIKQIRDRYGIKFVVLDDMQFILNTSNSKDNEASRITKLMADFKQIANELNIHLIVIAHVNREATKTGGIPKIFDLKGGSGIEQLADYVIFVHRDISPDAPEEIKEDVDIAISKNRIEGDTGVVRFKYYSDRCDYVEI